MHDERSNTSSKIARLLALALAATITLGACGTVESEESATDLPSLQTGADGSDEGATDGDDSDKEPSEADQEAAFAKYESCMTDLGVDVGSLGGNEGAAVQSFEADSDDGAEFNFEEFEEASKECETILTDTFGEFELSPEQQAEHADENLELERCLGDAGFDIDLSGNSFQLPDDVDFEAFEEAMATCQPNGLVSSEEVGG